MEYTIARLNRLLDAIKERAISSTSAQEAIVEFLQDQDFMTMIFRPSALNLDANELKEPTYEMYAKINRPRCLKILADGIAYEGYEKFNRNTAAFLHSIASIGIEASKKREARLRDDIVEENLTHREIVDEKDTIARLNNALAKIIHVSEKIVKSQAKRVAKESGLDRELVAAVLGNVPEPEMISVYQVGFYTEKVLNTIYSYTDRTGDGVARRTYDLNYFGDVRPTEDVDWEALFRALFGEKNVIEAATYILLEGVSKLDTYKNPNVKKVWDSITRFALGELEKVPRAVQTQMLDLYVKKITKMFRNKTYDLRVDMRALNKLDLPNLVSTIQDEGYDKKISDVIRNIAEAVTPAM